nr:MAG TPA: putative tail component [Caudoviricetes sp.]
MNYRITSHREELLEQFNARLLRALEAIGLVAEGHAQVNLTRQHAVDTGNLRNSIAHKVLTDEKKVIIGTDVEYAPYIEFGTGIYTSGGRQTPWAYQDAEGDFYLTRGMRARPFLKPAVTEHKEEYKRILRENTQN